MLLFLMIAHVGLFALSIFGVRGKRFTLLNNLSIPFGVGFLYTSVIQAWASSKSPGLGLDKADIQQGVWVSLCSYLAFLLAYWFTPAFKGRPLVSDRGTNLQRLNSAGLLCCLAGVLGYYLSIREVGGVRAYLNLAEWTGDLYEISGYVYMLKYALYAAVAVWLLCLALNGLGRWMNMILVCILLGLLLEAVQITKRSDTIRVVLSIVAWIYLMSHQPRRRGEFVAWGNAIITGILICLATAVLVLPQFRDQGRSMLHSQNTLSQALVSAQATGGSSRISAEGGGEFDSGARIVKRLNAGEFKAPGPVFIARLFWNIIPRSLVPDKWDLFDAWAGPGFQEVWYGSASYYGCTPTGWGEAYGCMGWIGAMLYWLALGGAIRKFEGTFGSSTAGLVLAAVCFLPLIDYVVMTFWSASMALCTVVVPVLLLLKWCQQDVTRNARNRRKRNSQVRPESSISPQPTAP